MKKKVLKFGGTSVGTIERILHVANILKKEHNAGNELIVIVSAMSGKTNELIEYSKTISSDFDKRELDVLLSSGEQVTCSLLAGALIELGIKRKRREEKNGRGIFRSLVSLSLPEFDCPRRWFIAPLFWLHMLRARPILGVCFLSQPFQ